jgi:tetratricopeptide (TPR) repeat protein
MEFLIKTGIFISVILLMTHPIVISQENKAILSAFEQSYHLEKKADYTKAAEAIKKVYEEKSYEMNLRLGWLQYEANLFNESLIYYQRASELMPYCEEAKFGLTYPAAALGKWDQVIKLYQKILEISPNNTIANYKLGLIYYNQNNYTKAFDFFNKVVNLYPFDYEGLLMFAWTNFKLGKMKEAKVLFNKVLMYSPNDASALEGLGYIK